MRFSYNIKGVIHTFWYHDIAKDMSHLVDGLEDGNRSILSVDENGNQTFIFDGVTINFNDFLCHTPEELIALFQKNEGKDEDLCHTLMKYGLDCLIVYYRMEKCGSNYRNKMEDRPFIPYRFEADILHNPIDNYKLKMVQVRVEDKGVYPWLDMYVSDLVSSLNDKRGIAYLALPKEVV